MGEKNLMAIAILGIIIGVSGLGIGVLAIMQIQSGAINGEKGDEGDDGSNGSNGTDGTDGTDGTLVIVNETVISYVCSSESEINNALDAIGGRNGTITIIDNIILTNTITINGGGSYVIQGQGFGITISIGGSRPAFNITNAKFCTIRELRIDSVSSNVNVGAIHIDEKNDNPVYIEKVQLIGVGDGTGIIISSNNTWISDCYIRNFGYGIYQNIYRRESNAHICNNKIYGPGLYGIRIEGRHNYISENNLESMNYGIYCRESYNTITSNVIYSSSETAIDVSGNNNIIGNNIIDLPTHNGILIDGDHNVISGNQISRMLPTCYAIFISGDFNAISGNQIFSSESDNVDGINIRGDSNAISGNQISGAIKNGISLNDNANSNVISGNNIYNGDHDFSSSNITGIHIASNSDNNTINGNGCFGFQNYDILYFGNGIYIASSNCNNNLIVGNTCQSNDYPYRDYGTNTVEDGNNFLS